jgi:hypothetical protein
MAMGKLLPKQLSKIFTTFTTPLPNVNNTEELA